MTYSELRQFILYRMLMHEVYQPVMLIALLNSKGKCSVGEIAQKIYEAIPAYRRQPVNHYEGRIKRVAGPVLQRHNIVEREGRIYRLRCYKSLNEDEIKDLVNLCKDKLEEYLRNHG